MDPPQTANSDNSEGCADTEGSTLINRLMDFTASSSDKEKHSDIIQQLVVTESDLCVPDELRLPDIALTQILKYLATSRYDQPIILAPYRLICRQWNAIIEDTSQLMKKITFPVWHPKQLLDLDIVQRKKVKSIKFMCSFQVESKYAKNLIELISDTIEKVEFAFENCDFPNQMELFRLVFENCGRLQEVIVNDNSTNQDDDIPVQKMFGNLPSTISIAAANKISVLLLDVPNYNEEDAVGISMCILKLPHLREIQLNGNCNGLRAQLILLKGLCEYLKIYEKTLHLQELMLPPPIYVDETEYWEIIILLLILCEKHSVAVEGLPVINLNCLLALTGSTILPLQLLQHRPIFTAIIDTELHFEKEEADDDNENNDEQVYQAITNFDRLHSLNIRKLIFYFKRSLVKPEELIWIHEIKGLESLQLLRDVELQSSSISTLRSLFSVGFPLLTKLELHYDIFGSLDKFPWSQDFPNLNELFIGWYEETPKDLISQLTVLESLTILRLRCLANFVDESFTMQFENRFGDHLMAPAICCFKQLKVLEIQNCRKLTEDYLIHGIAHCSTFERLVIKTNDLSVRKACESLKMQCEVEFTDGSDDDSEESDSE